MQQLRQTILTTDKRIAVLSLRFDTAKKVIDFVGSLNPKETHMSKDGIITPLKKKAFEPPNYVFEEDGSPRKDGKGPEVIFLHGNKKQKNIM